MNSRLLCSGKKTNGGFCVGTRGTKPEADDFGTRGAKFEADNFGTRGAKTDTGFAADTRGIKTGTDFAADTANFPLFPFLFLPCRSRQGHFFPISHLTIAGKTL